MSSLLTETPEAVNNPLDLLEQVAAAHEWPCQRQSDEEFAAEIPGQWAGYRLWSSWHPEVGVLHLSCTLDLEVPDAERKPIHTLLALANEKLWLGHFELWSEERLPVFRHSVLFREGMMASRELIEDLVEIALNECDRFYPAFQFVVRGGQTPEEALTAALLETEGEA